MTAPAPRSHALPPRSLVAPLVALTVLVGACSSESDPAESEVATLRTDESAAVDAADAATIGTEPATDLSPDEVALEFSQCMRDKGLDFPDLSVDAEGNIELREAFQSVTPGSEDFRSAMDSCQELLARAGFGGGRQEALASPEVQDGLIAFSDCVRDAGYDVGDLTLARGNGQGPGQGAGADGDGESDGNAAADAVDEAGDGAAEGGDGEGQGRRQQGFGNRGARFAEQLGLDYEDPDVQETIDACMLVLDEALSSAGLGQPGAGNGGDGAGAGAGAGESEGEGAAEGADA